MIKVKVTLQLALPPGTDRDDRCEEIRDDDVLQNWMIFETVNRLGNAGPVKPLRVNVDSITGVEPLHGRGQRGVVVHVYLDVRMSLDSVPFDEIERYVTKGYTNAAWGFFAQAPTLQNCNPRVTEVVQLGRTRPGKS